MADMVKNIKKSSDDENDVNQKKMTYSASLISIIKTF